MQPTVQETSLQAYNTQKQDGIHPNEQRYEYQPNIQLTAVVPQSSPNLSDTKPNPLNNPFVRYTIASVGILIVVACWVFKAAIVQNMQKSNHDCDNSVNATAAAALPDFNSFNHLLTLQDSSSACNGTSTNYNKPFFISYCTCSSYSIFLLICLLMRPALASYFFTWLRSIICPKREDGDFEAEYDASPSAEHADEDHENSLSRNGMSPGFTPSQSFNRMKSPRRSAGDAIVVSSNALISHLDAAAEQMRVKLEEEKQRQHEARLAEERLQAIRDATIAPAIRRNIPKYARCMKIAMCLSALYQISGWFTNLSLNNTSLAINTSVWNSGCVIVYFLEGVFLGHSLRDIQKIFGVLLCFSGVAVLGFISTEKKPDQSDSNNGQQGDHANTPGGLIEVLVAMVIYSTFEVLFKYASDTPEESDESRSSSPTPNAVDDKKEESQSRSHSNPSSNSNPSQKRGSLNDAMSVEMDRSVFSPSHLHSVVVDQPALLSPTPASSPVASTAFPTIPDAPAAIVSRKNSATAADAEKAHSEPFSESFYSSSLFLGSMGFTLFCTQWLLGLILNYSKIEPFEWPDASSAHVILMSMSLDCLLNISILTAIYFSDALFVNAGCLLSIPTSILYDYFQRHFLIQATAGLAVGLLGIGFVVLNFPFKKLLCKGCPCKSSSGTSNATVSDPNEPADDAGGEWHYHAMRTNHLVRNTKKTITNFPIGPDAADASGRRGSSSRKKEEEKESFHYHLDDDDDNQYSGFSTPVRMSTPQMSFGTLNSHLLVKQ